MLLDYCLLFRNAFPQGTYMHNSGSFSEDEGAKGSFCQTVIDHWLYHGCKVEASFCQVATIARSRHWKSKLETLESTGAQAYMLQWGYNYGDAYGHMTCVRRHRDTWYMIDSETEGAQPLLYPEDWHCVRGDLYALHAGNAYEHGRLPPHHIESPPAGEITQTGRQIIDGDFLRHMEYEQYVTALKVRDLVFHVRDHPWAPPDLGTIDLSGGDDATMTTPPDETHVTKKIKKKTKKEMKPQGTYRGGGAKTTQI
jgi:hypothetical protein